jgi:hypothetical protein
MFFGTFNVVAGVAVAALQVLLTGRVLRHGRHRHDAVHRARWRSPSPPSACWPPARCWPPRCCAPATRCCAIPSTRRPSSCSTCPCRPRRPSSVKSFIDTVVYRMGDGLGGRAGAGIRHGARLEPRGPVVGVAGAAGGWMAAAAVARREYVENLQDSIHQHRLDAERGSTPVLERTATDILSASWRRHRRDRLRAQPVRDGPRPRRAPGRARPAVAPGAGGAAPGAGAAVARRRPDGDQQVQQLLAIPTWRCAPRRCCTSPSTQRGSAGQHRVGGRLRGFLDPRLDGGVPRPARAARRTPRRRG